MLGGAPSVETVREHLEHLLAGSRFRASESLRRFLRYTVEAALTGRGDSLKEYTIGVEALGRPESFDPRQDTIVRVQSRKLRERLAAYYADEGSVEETVCARKQLLERAAADRCLLAGFHLPGGLGTVEARETSFRWEPAVVTQLSA